MGKSLYIAMDSITNIPALILVGGLGTRLRSVIGEFPKPMVGINGKPFLEYLIRYLRLQGIVKIILCVGYKHEVIEKFFGDGDKFGVGISYAVEKELLGTAGAIKNAEEFLEGHENFLVLNGDSFLKFSASELLKFHKSKNANFTFLVTTKGEEERSGNIMLNQENKVIKFMEKENLKDFKDKTYINSGIYIMQKRLLDVIPTNRKYSLEYDLMSGMLDKNVFAQVTTEELIDIGTPESLQYFRQNTELFFHE